MTKGEIAGIEQFLLLNTSNFSSFLMVFYPFRELKLSSLSVWKSLKIVFMNSVNLLLICATNLLTVTGAICIPCGNTYGPSLCLK